MASCDDDFSLLSDDNQTNPNHHQHHHHNIHHHHHHHHHQPYPHHRSIHAQPPQAILPPVIAASGSTTAGVVAEEQDEEEEEDNVSDSPFPDVNPFSDNNSNIFSDSNPNVRTTTAEKRREPTNDVNSDGYNDNNGNRSNDSGNPYNSYKKPRHSTTPSECRKDREEWSDAAIECLLDVYTEKFRQLNRGNLRGRDWEEVAVTVSERCQKQSKTVEQCKNKVDNLKKRYKLERHRMSNGGLSVSHWPWFKHMEEIVGNALPTKVVNDDLKGGCGGGGGGGAGGSSGTGVRQSKR